MSLSQNPVMGKMAKSFANVNTYVHKGQNVISAKAFNRKDKNSEAQQAHRAGFKLISEVYNSIGGFINAGFPVRPETQSPYNYFMALNLPNAIDNSGDVPVIDYSLLQISKGSLPGVEVLSATVTNGGITLECESCFGYGQSAVVDDLITVLCRMKNGALYFKKQPRGSEETCQLVVSIPAVVKENIEFVYVFVTSTDGKKASNSMYVPIS
jgi:hypothetical protein